jgi:hypothetical protein
MSCRRWTCYRRDPQNSLGVSFRGAGKSHQGAAGYIGRSEHGPARNTTLIMPFPSPHDNILNAAGLRSHSTVYMGLAHDPRVDGGPNEQRSRNFRSAGTVTTSTMAPPTAANCCQLLPRAASSCQQRQQLNRIFLGLGRISKPKAGPSRGSRGSHPEVVDSWARKKKGAVGAHGVHPYVRPEAPDAGQAPGPQAGWIVTSIRQVFDKFSTTLGHLLDNFWTTFGQPLDNLWIPLGQLSDKFLTTF